MDDQVPNVRSDCACVVVAPFGRPGGARGEDEVGDVVGLDRGGPGGGRGRIDRVAGREEVGETRDGPAVGSGVRTARRALVAQEDGASQVAGVLARQHARVVGAQEAAHRHEGRRAGVADDVGRLTTLVPRVQRHQHRTGPQEPERGEHPLGAVGRPHGHPVARPDTGGHEAAGVAVDLGSQLRVGQAHVPVHQGLRAAVPQCRIVHQVRHRAPDEVGPRVLLVGRGAADPRSAHL